MKPRPMKPSTGGGPCDEMKPRGGKVKITKDPHGGVIRGIKPTSDGPSEGD